MELAAAGGSERSKLSELHQSDDNDATDRELDPVMNQHAENDSGHAGNANRHSNDFRSYDVIQRELDRILQSISRRRFE